MTIQSQLAEARTLLGQAMSAHINVARAEQLAAVDESLANRDQQEAVRYIEKCDTWCAEYDKRLNKQTTEK